MNRTTNGNGYVWNFNFKELKQLDAGFNWTDDDSLTFPYRNKGISIPSLKEVLDTFSSYRINIEIKKYEPWVITNFCNILKEKTSIFRLTDESAKDDLAIRLRRIAATTIEKI